MICHYKRMPSPMHSDGHGYRTAPDSSASKQLGSLYADSDE